MAAPKGNLHCKGKKNARKLKTENQMNKVYKSYCDHLACGKVKKSWFYEDGELTLTWETMENYIAKEPRNFDPLKKDAAVAKGMSFWENVVDASAIGENKNANTATLQMLMRNKYGWDKDDPSEKETSAPMIKTLAKKWRGQ